MSDRPVYLSVCFNLSLTKFRLLRLLRRQQNKVNSNVWRLKFVAWFVYKYSKFGSHVKVLTREFFCDYTDVFVIIFCCVNLTCYINFLYVPVAYRIKDIGDVVIHEKISTTKNMTLTRTTVIWFHAIF